MTIKTDILQQVCAIAQKQVQDMIPKLELAFIPHEMGRLYEIVDLGEHGISHHPAHKIGLNILEKNKHRELTSFLGLAIHQQIKWLGLASNETMLGLFNVNVNEFDTPKDLRRAVYHYIWHALDLIDIRTRPEYAAKFRSGPMIPKRSPMNLARLNLQADVFSAVMAGLMGEEDSIDVLAAQRALDSIRPVHARRAEDYPFVIAMESAKFGFEKLLEAKPQKHKFMPFARQLAIEVGKTFDETSIRQWWGFSEPAQDMAWRNQTGEIILGSAVLSSEDSFVRATGHLVCDITGIEPAGNLLLIGKYNAFKPKEENKLLHRELMEKTFEEAMALGLREESGRPLLLAANKQNEGLTNGVIIGWCANALQAAAKAFDSAISSGRSPVQAAKLEFEGTKDVPQWEALEKLGNKIVDERRSGRAVTLGGIADLCENDKNFAPVMGAVVNTMKDPDYIKQLEVANEFALSKPAPAAPSAPTPKAPAPAAPVPSAPAFSAPGLGLGGGGNNAAARQRFYAEQARRKAEEEAQK